MSRILDAVSRLLPGRAGLPHAKASAVGPLIAWEALGQPVWTPRDYSAFAREGYMQNAIVYRSIRMIAEAAASVPLLLYEGEEEVTEQGLLDLLAQPSPDQTTTDFLESWHGFLLVAGNAYVEAVGLSGRLRELHVLRPDRMKVVPGADGGPEAFEYSANGRSIRFAEEPVPGMRPVLHVRLFQPANDHYGMSPIEATAPATIGASLDDLSEGPAGRIDHGARLRVQIKGEELVSITRLQLLAGQNAAAVRNSDGDWEVLQFQNAELVDVDTYELSELLCGQSGTEFAMRPAVSAGASFVLLNSAIAPVDLAVAEIRLPYSWRYGPSKRDIGDASYAVREHTFQGLGLKPLSPVHVRASRSDDDVAISWVRRTRIGGDSWESPEVPLSEDIESYEVDILDGETVLRTLIAFSPAVTYTAAQQVADFGSPQPAYSVRIYQLSGTYGRGTPRAAVV